MPPVIMGHEASGIIIKTGKNVKKFSKDDRVTFDSTIYCGKCRFCQTGLINLCDNRKVMGVSCNEYSQNGALAEYVAVPDHIIYHLPEKVTFEQAAMTEPLSIALHSINRIPLSSDKTAVVVGSGIIGLLIIQLMKIKGYRKIFAVDIEQNKLNIACKLGADEGFNSNVCDVPFEINKRTQNCGVDVSFDAVGIKESFNTAIDCLRKGGTLSLIGNLSPYVNFPLQKVVTKQITILGSCASCGEYPECLDMIANNKIDFNPLISQVAPLSEGAVWFERLKNKEKGLLKVILIP